MAKLSKEQIIKVLHLFQEVSRSSLVENIEAPSLEQKEELEYYAELIQNHWNDFSTEKKFYKTAKEFRAIIEEGKELSNWKVSITHKDPKETWLNGINEITITPSRITAYIVKPSGVQRSKGYFYFSVNERIFITTLIESLLPDFINNIQSNTTTYVKY